MAELFLKILNMSISATWLVLAVLVARLCLKKAPKWVHVLLWGIVAVRLLCPISIVSAMSLIPSAETIPDRVISGPDFNIQSGIPPVDTQVNGYLDDHYLEGVTVPTNHGFNVMNALTILWLIGIGVMLVYTAVSYFRLRRRVSTATRLYGNIFQSARIPSPFVLGIFRPQIYLPFDMDAGDMAHVIAHEQTHIRRKDHWWKPLGFGLLAVHWFNPFMWFAYILLCRDIELACDEKVIRTLGRDQRADYSQALLSCSVDRRMIAACPLAFGEVGVKERVKNVLHYKKPAFWVVILAVVLCCVVAVCFLTDPAPSREFAMNGNNVADLNPWQIVDTIAEMEDLDDGSALNINPMNFNLQLTEDFEWDNSQAIRFFYTKDRQEYSAQLRIFPEEGNFYVTTVETRLDETLIFKFYHYLEALKYLPQDAIRAMCPDADGYIITQRAGGSPDEFDRVITYTADGTQAIDGWLIHFELQPLHDMGDGMQGTGEEVIHLFYRDSGVDVDYGILEWFDFGVESVFDYPLDLEKTHPAFRGVTFRCNGYEITAVDETGETVLFTGMPVWNVYFTDLTGDGKPEICATVSFGSGMVDTHVVVYDYVNGQEYTLWDRGNYDFYLRSENDMLVCDQFAYPIRPMEAVDPVASGWLILTDAGGGTGKQLTMNLNEIKPGVKFITGIVDRSETEQLPTDEAIEVFYEDEHNTYSFASIRSHLVMVTYSDGSTEDIRTAQEAGRATVRDLDRFGIHYYTAPKTIPMEPVRTNLRGLVAGYLFTPINGATYRYALTEPDPSGVTAAVRLDAFSEETAVEGVAWEVYSLKEYPDMTKLLLLSGTNSAWLCEYAPSQQAEAGALQAAKEAGYVVEEDGWLTSGGDAWQYFYEATQRGTPAFIQVAHYYTLDPDRTDSATYEAYKQDYPSLHICELSYDGDIFVLRTEDDVRVFEYLMKYTVSGTPLAASTEHVNINHYVLTHDKTHTWDQLWRSLASSAAGVAIDHYTVCTEKS